MTNQTTKQTRTGKCTFWASVLEANGRDFSVTWGKREFFISLSRHLILLILKGKRAWGRSGLTTLHQDVLLCFPILSSVSLWAWGREIIFKWMLTPKPFHQSQPYLYSLNGVLSLLSFTVAMTFSSILLTCSSYSLSPFVGKSSSWISLDRNTSRLFFMVLCINLDCGFSFWRLGSLSSWE